ncbi:MAG: carboxypeptidase-like regulatory domain-containing protein [Acidimicrobiia bacterium]
MRSPGRRGPARAGLWVAALAGLVVVAAACTDDDDGTTLDELPPPPPATTTTTAVDFSKVALPPSPPVKAPPSTRPREPGRAIISGRVIDDNGAPVPGAKVQASYYLNPGDPETIGTFADVDGSYRFDAVYGGSWRLRAWMAPTLATLEDVEIFLQASENKAIDLKVKIVPAVGVSAAVAPPKTLFDTPAELAVRVVSQTVDEEGRVVRSELPGTQVTLSLPSRWTLMSGNSNPLTSDSDGTVRWTMVCEAVGTDDASVYVDAAAQWLTIRVPDCVDPASTTTTTEPPPETTTTTSGRRRSATTDGSEDVEG